MNPVVTASAGLISLLLGAWLALVALKPRRWRMRWMDLFGTLDADTARPEKRRQENQLRRMAGSLLLVMLLMSASCGFWTWSSLHDAKRQKSKQELETELLEREIRARTGSAK
ncbi:MAG: hypothetical protein JNJ83_04080 [Verrucomicrobiaceae bacterium]|nr:hypothetical protein [Verrucomicrobiaceae bacterium]